MKLLVCIVVCLGLALSARAYSFFGDDERSDDLMMGDEGGDKSMLKQNFHADCEAALNELAQEYFKATYFYMTMGIALQKPDVNHRGFALLCSTVGKKKLRLAKAIMFFIHKRGGDVTLANIQAPVPNEWQNPVKVLRQAIGRERQIGAKLLSVFKIANRHNDPYLCPAHLGLSSTFTSCVGIDRSPNALTINFLKTAQTHDFLEREIMAKQAEALPEFVKYLTRFKKAGIQMGTLSGNVELVMKYKDLVLQCV